jgi:hypothetical protein
MVHAYPLSICYLQLIWIQGTDASAPAWLSFLATIELWICSWRRSSPTSPTYGLYVTLHGAGLQPPGRAASTWELNVDHRTQITLEGEKVAERTPDNCSCFSPDFIFIFQCTRQMKLEEASCIWLASRQMVSKHVFKPLITSAWEHIHDLYKPFHFGAGQICRPHRSTGCWPPFQTLLTAVRRFRMNLHA